MSLSQRYIGYVDKKNALQNEKKVAPKSMKLRDKVETFVYLGYTFAPCTAGVLVESRSSTRVYGPGI